MTTIARTFCIYVRSFAKSFRPTSNVIIVQINDYFWSAYGRLPSPEALMRHLHRCIRPAHQTTAWSSSVPRVSRHASTPPVLAFERRKIRVTSRLMTRTAQDCPSRRARLPRFIEQGEQGGKTCRLDLRGQERGGIPKSWRQDTCTIGNDKAHSSESDYPKHITEITAYRGSRLLITLSTFLNFLISALNLHFQTQKKCIWYKANTKLVLLVNDLGNKLLQKSVWAGFAVLPNRTRWIPTSRTLCVLWYTGMAPSWDLGRVNIPTGQKHCVQQQSLDISPHCGDGNTAMRTHSWEELWDDTSHRRMRDMEYCTEQGEMKRKNEVNRRT